VAPGRRAELLPATERHSQACNMHKAHIGKRQLHFNCMHACHDVPCCWIALGVSYYSFCQHHQQTCSCLRCVPTSCCHAVAAGCREARIIEAMQFAQTVLAGLKPGAAHKESQLKVRSRAGGTMHGQPAGISVVCNVLLLTLHSVAHSLPAPRNKLHAMRVHCCAECRRWWR
jgi:hypothetical protein